MHAMLFQTALLGSHAIKVPSKQGAGSISQAGTETPDSTLILLRLPEEAPKDQLVMEELRSAGVAPTEAHLTVISADPTPVFAKLTDADDAKDADAAITSGDPEGHARLFAMYTGQLQSRIERIWRRPRSSISGAEPAPGDAAEVFRCQVIVRQDAQRRIQEILLPNCNGSAAWQQSLVMAINGAAPLPPPPNQSVFSETLNFNFVALPYTPGISPDGYELPPRTLAGLTQ